MTSSFVHECVICSLLYSLLPPLSTSYSDLHHLYMPDIYPDVILMPHDFSVKPIDLHNFHISYEQLPSAILHEQRIGACWKLDMDCFFFSVYKSKHALITTVYGHWIMENTISMSCTSICCDEEMRNCLEKNY